MTRKEYWLRSVDISEMPTASLKLPIIHIVTTPTTYVRRK